MVCVFCVNDHQETDSQPDTGRFVSSVIQPAGTMLERTAYADSLSWFQPFFCAIENAKQFPILETQWETGGPADLTGADGRYLKQDSSKNKLTNINSNDNINHK